MSAVSSTARDRWLALALLLAVLGLLWLLLLRPMFGQPLQQANAELADLQARDARLRSLMAQKPLVEQRMAALAARGGGPGFLVEATAELATASLIQQLEQVVNEASASSRGCALVNRTPLGDEPQTGRYRRVTVQVRLRCGNAETLAVLHALQTARPYLFIDNLSITAQRYFAVPGSGQPQEGGLDVSFNLYGYLRPGLGATHGR